MGGRNGSSRAWRRVRARVLTASDVCGICGEPGADSVDHIVPVSKGGAELDPANLRPAHLACNVRRGASGLAPLGRRSRDW